MVAIELFFFSSLYLMAMHPMAILLALGAFYAFVIVSRVGVAFLHR